MTLDAVTVHCAINNIEESTDLHGHDVDSTDPSVLTSNSVKTK